MRVAFLLFFISLTTYAQTGPCAVQTGPLKPDLAVKLSDVHVGTETFAPDSCAVQEGGLTSGSHTLIRFTTTTPNVGDTDLRIGNPANCGDLYEVAICHNHHHLRDYSDYRLWTDAGYAKWVKVRNLNLPIANTPNETYLIQAAANGELVSGHKQAFCIIDVRCAQGNCLYHPEGTPGWFKQSTGEFFQCSNQGLSVGWEDEYSYLLDGQWVVMDGLPRGKYVLEVQINPNWVFQEKTYTNNVSAVKFVY